MRKEAVIRLVANALIGVGLFLLAYTLYGTVSGSLAIRFFNGAQRPWMYDLYALCLMLPVPLHVISIGLIVKRKWMPPFWSRAAWPAIILSGCWLGAALAVRYMIV